MTTIHEQSLLEGLLELSDKTMQENLWDNADENIDEMSSYGEAVCFVFDDSGASRAFEKGQLETVYGADFTEKFAQLDSLVCLVPMELSPKEIIEHPRMVEIREVAGELVRLLENETI